MSGFRMLGDADAAACVDGVCAVPGEHVAHAQDSDSEATPADPGEGSTAAR